MSFDDIHRLARQLPQPQPDAERIAQVRRTVLTEVARTPQRSSRRRAPYAVAAAGILGVAILAGSYFARTPEVVVPMAPQLARVTASGAATFEHRIESTGAVEVVSLHDGTIRIDAVHLEPGQRFLVATNDAEVEVRGTVFEVEARRGELTRVAVIAGRVEVRREGHPAFTLAPKQTWLREPPATALVPPKETPKKTAKRAPPVPKKIVERPKPVETPKPALPEPPNKAEVAFQLAWEHFRAGRFSNAAADFALADAPDSPVREEASYWRAVSLVRANDDAAEAALRRFAAAYPNAARADEAALLLGRLLDRRDDPEAKTWLRRAASSPRSAVREKAERLLGTPRDD